MNANPQRILVRGVNWIGDAVMTTPALLRLREAHPRAEITLLAHEKLMDLWLRHPAVDQVLTFSAAESAWSVASRLRNTKFNMGIVFPNSPRSALELWLAGIPVRIGLRKPWRSWLLTQNIAPSSSVQMRKKSDSEIRALAEKTQVTRETFPAEAHQSRHYLSIVGAAGANTEPVAPVIFVADDEVQRARDFFNLVPLDAANRPLFALNAGAEYGPAKRWPEDRFIEAANHVAKMTGCAWIICGGPGDKDLAIRVAVGLEKARTTAINLAGKTSLRQLCAVLKASRLLLSNDSGPMHIAAAVGTPVIVPFGSTSLELTGPGLPGDPRHKLIVGQASCAPCFRRECPIDFRCQQSISTSEIVAAILQVWSTPR